VILLRVLWLRFRIWLANRKLDLAEVARGAAAMIALALVVG